MSSNPKAEKHFWCLKEVCNIGLSYKEPSFFFFLQLGFDVGVERAPCPSAVYSAQLRCAAPRSNPLQQSPWTKKHWHSFSLTGCPALPFYFLLLWYFLTLTFSSGFDWSNVIFFSKAWKFPCQVDIPQFSQLNLGFF